jgi:phosphomannomutase
VRQHSLKIGVSGVRGIVGESLTPELVVSFAQAFATYLGSGDILVGRDTRPSGPMVREGVVAGLLSSGCRPVDLGICPTPSVLIRTAHSDAVGAICITASHNPARWNALKFVGTGGLFLDAHEAFALLDIYHQGEFTRCPNADMAVPERLDDAVEFHTEKVLRFLDTDVIRDGSFRVVVDCCNAAASAAAPDLLKRLGTHVTGLYCEFSDRFPREPEPVPDNVGALREAVVSEKADVGFALDPDGDRLALVDETGTPVSEEYTLVLVADHLLRKKVGTVVTNVSTTRAVDEVAARYGASVVRTKVGEINVTRTLLQRKGVVGGEGNGGIIIPDVHPCRDALVGMGVVLELMATSGMPLSRLVASMPQYAMYKRKVPCSPSGALRALGELKRRYADRPVSTVDGITINWDESWTNVRPSNTEPIIRVVAEARTRDDAQQLAARIASEIEAIVRPS